MNREHTERAWLKEGVAWAVSVLGLVALIALFTFGDLILGISAHPTAVVLTLGLGGLVTLPIVLKGRRSVRRLMAAIAIYGVFSAWIVTLKQVDWDARKPFLRAYQQIRPGMTQADVESLMHRQFAGKKQPVAHWRKGSGSYILDPDDGRFNSEIIAIKMLDDRVVSADYLAD